MELAQKNKKKQVKIKWIQFSKLFFKTSDGGASAVPCTDTYGGVSPFSEPETKALIDFYATIFEKVKLFLSFHSATQALLYPWGDVRPKAPNTDDLVRF